MEERGTVLDCAGGVARVRIDRSEACQGCTLCTLSEDGEHMVARAMDHLGVSTGDRVRIETPGAATPLAAALLLFLVPLSFLFGGYGAGALIAALLRIPGAAQPLGAGAAVVFFLGSFAVLSAVTKGRRGGRGAAQSVIVERL